MCQTACLVFGLARVTTPWGPHRSCRRHVISSGNWKLCDLWFTVCSLFMILSQSSHWESIWSCNVMNRNQSIREYPHYSLEITMVIFWDEHTMCSSFSSPLKATESLFSVIKENRAQPNYLLELPRHHPPPCRYMIALLRSVSLPRCFGWYNTTSTPSNFSSVTLTCSSETGAIFSKRVMKYITPM